MSYQSEKFTEIADAIRAATGSEDLIKASEFSDKIGEIHSKGRQSFWNDFQQDGNKKHYNYTFAYGSFDKNTFNPIHPIDCTDGGNSVFRQYTSAADIALTYPAETAIREINVPIIFSNKAAAYVFDHCYYLKSIKKIIVTSSTSFSNWFRNCTELIDVIFEGEIANALDMSSCPKLSVGSMKSIIGCVVNPIELKFNNAAWTRLEADSTAPNGDTWKNYVKDVLGCTI